MSNNDSTKQAGPSQAPGSTRTRGPGGHDRRAYRRFDLSRSETWISTVPSFSLLDVSSTGAGLRSNYPVRSGEIIRISVKGGPSADALVVYCRIGAMPEAHLVNNFHVGCRFISRKEASDLTDRIEYQLASMIG